MIYREEALPFLQALWMKVFRVLCQLIKVQRHAVDLGGIVLPFSVFLGEADNETLGGFEDVTVVVRIVLVTQFDDWIFCIEHAKPLGVGISYEKD